ncbi:hypothetical protein [Paenibacillus konkukensis]|uniref:hypothetical protein n=1 Tax=Paenibacillus konkukensis TaxID=2020716 RepID=UPI00201DEA7E|nr:hypothetical protein [Paenibacillus konkukensis]
MNTKAIVFVETNFHSPFLEDDKHYIDQAGNDERDGVNNPIYQNIERIGGREKSDCT